MQIKALKLEVLNESPTNPRKTFANMDRLIQSVKEAGGVLVPLIVRADPKRDGEFEIVAGHRRFRAAKAAKLKEVPCDVRELTDAAVVEIQLTENLQREDLSHLEEAETYDAMIKAHGYTPESIAQKISVGLGTVYARLKLLALGPEGRKAFAEGKLPASVAVPLARLSTHGLQARALKELERFADEDGVFRARDSVEFLRHQFVRALRSASFDVKDTMLIEGAGACAVCPKNSRCGPPSLFEDLNDKGQAFCTDLVCFDAKTRAAWEIVVAEHEAAGAKVLKTEDGHKLFPHGSLTHGSRYVELDTPNHADAKKRTWREFYERLIPSNKAPRLTVAPDRDMKPRFLVEHDEILNALREAPNAPKWAEAEVERKVEIAEQRAEQRAEKKEADLRGRVQVAALKKMASKFAKTKIPASVLRFVLVGLADRFIPQAVLDALEVTREEYLAKIVKGDDAWRIEALLAWGALAGDFLDGEETPREFKALLADADVDLKVIEKAIVAGDAAEALIEGRLAKAAKAK